MKKFLTALLTAALLLTMLTVGVGAKDNSVWLISKDAVLTLPAELTKGYTEINSDMFDMDLSGYGYLHFKLMFAEDYHIEWQPSWGYVMLIDNADAEGKYESSKNVVTSNIAETKDYEGGTWYDFTLPFSSFNAYGAGSQPIAEWTDTAKMLRFVFITGMGNPEISVKDIYISVNENDAAPAESSQSGEENNPGSPDTGTGFMLTVMTALVSSASAVFIRKKRR